MRNPFRELKNIVRRRGIDQDRLVHALMATVYLNCCHNCASSLRSDEFFKTFDRMAGEMIRCAALSKRVA